MIVEQDTRRKSARIHLDRHVNLMFTRDSYDHRQTKNLSLTGMFATGNFQQQVGELCLLNLDQTEMPSDLSLHASAEVVRNNDEGVAVKFTSMPFHSFMFLQITLLNETEYPFNINQILPDTYPFEVTGHW